MKNIVVGVDFSASAMNAMRHAVALSIRTHARLHLLWVKTPGVYAGLNSGNDNEGYLAKANGKLEEWARLCRQESPESEVNTVILEGKVHVAVSKYAAALPESIIVMGTHGMSGFEEGYIGNNVYRLISSSTVPVLVMRENIHIGRDLHTIMTPIDDSFETLQKIRPAISLAKSFAAQIQLLGVVYPIDAETRHVIKVQMNNAAVMCNEANVRYVLRTIEVNNSKVCRAILDYAKKIDTNMVVIMREESESDFTASAFMNEILPTCPMPLLIIPNVNVFSVGK